MSSSIRTVFYDHSIVTSGVRHIRHELKKARAIVADAYGGAEHMCYVHHTRSWLAQALIGAEACAGYYVVEEGMSAYTVGWPEPMLGVLQRYIAFLLSAGQIEGFGADRCCVAHEKFRGVIAASEEAFPGVASKQVVGWPFAVISGHDEIQALFVFDAGSLGEPLIRDAIRRFSNQCWHGVFTQVGFKFHPRQWSGTRGRMREYLDQVGREYGLEFVELRDEALENLCFTRGRSLSVYFVASSVGFYSALMGCKAISLARFYANGGPGVPSAVARGLGGLIGTLPHALASKVEFL